MIASKTPILLFLSVLLLAVDAFVVQSPTASRSRTSTWMADAGEEEGPTEEAVAAEDDGNAASDILNSPEFLRRKMDVLKSDLEQAEQQLESEKLRYEDGKAEWGEQFDELAKEYKNIQERMNTQSSKGDDMATVQVTRQMLELMDNFDRAFGAVKPESEEQQAIEAEYKEAYSLVMETFGKLGVEPVETVGVEFDYEFHQAVMQKPTEDFESGIVCEEFAKGFKFGDTLIRAAMVAVAA